MVAFNYSGIIYWKVWIPPLLTEKEICLSKKKYVWQKIDMFNEEERALSKKRDLNRRRDMYIENRIIYWKKRRYLSEKNIYRKKTFTNLEIY